MKGLIIAWTLLFISVLAFGQYPNTGQKIRLGWQSSGDGLVYRGNGTPTYTPEIYDSSFVFIDTTAGTLYTYISGAWQLVSAGGGGGTSFDGHVDSLVFNSSVTVVDSIGKMYYDAANETISVGIDGGAVYQLGQELYYPLVINKSGATILNGQPVMVDTATLVTGDHVRVIPARNGATYPSDYVMGVATTDIPNDSTGLVTWFGYVREVQEADIAQTSITLNAGDILYISATEPGKYTNVRPSSPAHQSTVALVVRKPSVNNITLLVRPWLAPKLDNLSNVNVASVTGLSVLRYNSVTGIWDASATAGIVAADTAAMLSYYQKKLTNPVTGTGTAGQVAYWSGTTTQTGSSDLTWSSNRLNALEVNTQNLSYAATPLTIKPNATSSNSVVYLHPSGTGTSNILGLWDSTTVITGANGLNFGVGQSGMNANSWNIQSLVAGQLAVNSRNISFAMSSTARSRYEFATFQAQNARMGILQTSPSYTLDINATDAIRLPSGTTVQRPTGAAAVLRFNSDSTQLEYHNGTSWRGIVNTWDAGTSTGGGGGTSVWSTLADTVYLPSGKYVGIGTASPDSVLHVEGGAYLNGGLKTDVGLFMENPGYTNTGIRALAGSRTNRLPNFAIYPETSELNAGTTFVMIPKGTGYSTGIKAQLVFYNTDLFADRTNTEFMTVRAAGDAGFGIFSVKSGTGVVRPIFFNATGTQANTSDANIFLNTDGKVGIRNATPTSTLTINGNLSRNAPVTVTTSTYIVSENESWIIANRAGNITMTLPDPATCPGREIMFKNYANFYVYNVATEIFTLTGSLTNVILPNTAGKWATLVSDGSYWQIMQSN